MQVAEVHFGRSTFGRQGRRGQSHSGLQLGQRRGSERHVIVNPEVLKYQMKNVLPEKIFKSNTRSTKTGEGKFFFFFDHFYD